MAWLQQPLRTCWWFSGNGHEAVAFWVSLLPGSAIEGSHGPGNRPPLVIGSTLAGAPMMVLNAPGAPAPTHQASLPVLTADQEGTDRLWEALIAAGGTGMACGWITDHFGVSWQIMPGRLAEMLASPDRAAASRAMAAMHQMVKIDVATLEAAFAGAA